MSPVSKSTLSLLPVLLLTALWAVAGVPQLMNYQGRLTNPSGTPLDTTVSIIFTIYDDSTGGNPIWTETHSAVEVNNGLFSTTMGIIGVPILDDSTDWPIYSWVGIKVGSDPEIQPRTCLTSAPYAFKAARVDGFDPGPLNVTNGKYVFNAGDSNTVIGDYASIAGGYGNYIDEVNFTDTVLDTSDVGGVSGSPTGAVTGDRNPGAYSFIGGGLFNHDHGNFSVIGGGLANTAWCGASSVVGGYRNESGGMFSFVGGGYWNVVGTPTCNCGYISAIVGGALNRIEGDFSFIGGGLSNSIQSCKRFSTIGGGRGNVISNNYGTISGGYNNISIGEGSSIGGGRDNQAGGPYSVIPGGAENITDGQYSLAAGYQAQAYFNNSFVWNDGVAGQWGTTGNNQFLIHASGGVGIGTNLPSAALDVGGTARMLGFEMPSGAVNGYVLTCISTPAGMGSWQPLSSLTDGDWDYTTNSPNMFSVPSGNVGIGISTPTSKLHVQKAISTSGQPAVAINFSNNVGSIGATGLLSEGANLTGKGSQNGVIGKGSITYTSGTYDQDGSAEGRLASLSGYEVGGTFMGVYGASNPTLLTNFDGSQTSWGVGGRFIGMATSTSISVNGTGTYYIGGVYGEVNNQVDASGSNAIVAGVIGVDNASGTSNHRAAYLRGVLHLEPGAAPANPLEGDIYYDAASHTLRYYNGTIWITL